jgi:hypothetical protein
LQFYRMSSFSFQNYSIIFSSVIHLLFKKNEAMSLGQMGLNLVHKCMFYQYCFGKMGLNKWARNWNDVGECTSWETAPDTHK